MRASSTSRASSSSYPLMLFPSGSCISRLLVCVRMLCSVTFKWCGLERAVNVAEAGVAMSPLSSLSSCIPHSTLNKLVRNTGCKLLKCKTMSIPFPGHNNTLTLYLPLTNRFNTMSIHFSISVSIRTGAWVSSPA